MENESKHIVENIMLLVLIGKLRLKLFKNMINKTIWKEISSSLIILQNVNQIGGRKKFLKPYNHLKDIYYM